MYYYLKDFSKLSKDEYKYASFKTSKKKKCKGKFYK